MENGKRKILIFVVLLSICSCNPHRHSISSWQKVQNGVYPPASMIIITENKDTLCLAKKEPKFGGSFREKYTGQYFVGRNLDRIIFRCNIENGVLVGDYVRYYTGYSTRKILSQGYFANGHITGYRIIYHSNGIVNQINIYNPCNSNMQGGIWMYFDDSGELLKIEDYGVIPDSCLIPNQYLFDSLPEKYRYYYDTVVYPAMHKSPCK